MKASHQLGQFYLKILSFCSIAISLFQARKSKKFKMLVNTDLHYKIFLGNEANRGSGQRKIKTLRLQLHHN